MLFTPQNFEPNMGRARPVEIYDDIPDSLDVYQRTEANFLPDGKDDFGDLTEEELIHLQRQYRFDHYRPGQYQGITWIRIYKDHGL
jgi:hypothetical protein